MQDKRNIYARADSRPARQTGYSDRARPGYGGQERYASRPARDGEMRYASRQGREGEARYDSRQARRPGYSAYGNGYARRSAPVRRRRRVSRRFFVMLGGLSVFVVLVSILISVMGGRGDRARAGTAAPTPAWQLAAVETSAPTAMPDDGEVGDELGTEGSAQDDVAFDPDVAAFDPDTSAFEPDVISDTAATYSEDWRAGRYVPEPEGPGYLPVFRKANTQEKVIAITVDDCFQTENLKQIIQLALEANGKLTIFPIGRLLPREALQEALRYAHDRGFEIENHTFSHSALYDQTDTELAEQISNQDSALDYVLGVDHKAHFLRPRGGDDKNDLRTHAYMKQLGYYGVAHWSISGSDTSVAKLKSSIAPGEVYLFHCTDKDLGKLKQFIPYAAAQGYRLVTLNELFGYADNEETPLQEDPLTRPIVPLAEYARDYKTIKKPTYSYAAYEVQQRLNELGFSADKPDGVYGSGTENAVKSWQQSVGETPDGVLTPQLQKKLFGVSEN